MDIHHGQARILWKLVARLVSLRMRGCGEDPELTHATSSQAMDVGTLKNLQAETIRVLVWVLSFLSFGYATGEFEVTSDRLGVYRPEEHIEYVKECIFLERLFH